MLLPRNRPSLEFDLLCMEVAACNKCARMCTSKRILGRSSGSLTADILFVGEAPGRLGADGSGIPFHGDQSGHNFEALLAFAGLNRSDIFVTNAVLCNPKDDNGNNSTPTQEEIANCASFLRKQIEVVKPKIVVTLGATGLAVLKQISPHTFTLKSHVRTRNVWFDRILIPLYHPGQRAMMTRSMANQRSDYQFVAEQLSNFSKKKKPAQSKPKSDAMLIVDYIFSKKSSLTYFALHKLFYLIEYKSVQLIGDKLTNSYIVRQKDGPYCTDLHLFKIQKVLPHLKSKHLSKTNILLFRQFQNLFEATLLDQFQLSRQTLEIVDAVLQEHGNKSNAALKRSVYFTRPMRNILAIEAEQGINLYNSSIKL